MLKSKNQNQKLVERTTRATTQCFSRENRRAWACGALGTLALSDGILKRHVIKGQYLIKLITFNWSIKSIKPNLFLFCMTVRNIVMTTRISLICSFILSSFFTIDANVSRMTANYLLSVVMKIVLLYHIVERVSEIHTPTTTTARNRWTTDSHGLYPHLLTTHSY